MSFFEAIRNFLAGDLGPDVQDETEGLGAYQYNRSPEALTNLNVSRSGQPAPNPNRTAPGLARPGVRADAQTNVRQPQAYTPERNDQIRVSQGIEPPDMMNRSAPRIPNGGDLYDRTRAESMINQMVASGIAPEEAVGLAAAQLDASPGDTTAFNNRDGLFSNFQLRFDDAVDLRSFASRVGGDIGDLNEMLSYTMNESSFAEMAGYEYTEGAPGEASRRLSTAHDAYGRYMLDRPNRRVARIADTMMAELNYNEDGTVSLRPRYALGEQQPEMRPEMRPEMEQPQSLSPPSEEMAVPAAETSAPETSQRPIMRPPMSPQEAQEGLPPITYLNSDGNAVPYNRLTAEEKRDILFNFPGGARAITEQAAPPVSDDVNLSEMRATGEPRQPTDVTLPGGGDTAEERRAQGFLDRMFNRGGSLDAEEARMRRQNFFRVFAESLNYLTTGSANLGPVYASNDAREAEFRERREEGNQQRVLAEMAVNMGMGELVGLMQLGDAGVTAVRNAVITAAVSGSRVGGGGGGGGGGGAAAEEGQPLTPQERETFQRFDTALNANGDVVATAERVASQPAPATPTADTATPQGPDVDFSQPVENTDAISGFVLGEATPEPAPAPAPAPDMTASAPNVTATASAKSPAAPTGGDRTFMQSPITGGEEIGFSPDINRRYDERSLPGVAPGETIPTDPFMSAVRVAQGTAWESEIDGLVAQRENLFADGYTEDDTVVRQLTENIFSATTDAQLDRIERRDAAEQRAREEETERQRRNRMLSMVNNAFFRSPDVREAARVRAQSGSPEAERDLLEIISEEAEFNPATRAPRDTLATYDTLFEQWQEGANERQTLLSIADTQLEFLSDPANTPNALRTNVAIPILEYVDPIADFFGIDTEVLASDEERAAAAIASGQTIRAVAPQSADLPGAVSNIEFQAYQEPARVADRPRLTGLLVNQVMRRNAEREEIAQRARAEYIRTTPYMEQTPEGLTQAMADAVGEVEVIRDMPAEQLINMRESGAIDELTQEQRAEVVRVNYLDIDEQGNIVERTEYTTLGAYDDIDDSWLAAVGGEQ